MSTSFRGVAGHSSSHFLAIQYTDLSSSSIPRTARSVPVKELQTALREGRASDDRWHVREVGTRR
jgi:hypothetical protein